MTSPSRSRAWETAALTAAALFAFAANSLLCRWALAPRLIDPTSFTSIRIVSGASTLFVLTKVLRTRADLARPASGNWASALALFAYAIAFSLAYVRIGAGVGALVLFGMVQITMVSWGLVTGERPRLGEWVGLAVAVLGLAVFMLPGAHAPDPSGTGLMIVAGIAWGVYSLRGRKSVRPLLTTADNFLRAVPFALAASAAALVSGSGALGAVNWTVRGAALAVVSGAIASGLGYCLWYLALPRHSATRAALVQLLVPFIAALGAVVILGESITLRLFGGGGIVVAGVATAIAARAAAPR
ncbi:MAG TPA: DMT family transporter [Polyangiaceae bacterium]|nr:DMT family transporter [Polyangiaceae bacterium]